MGWKQVANIADDCHIIKQKIPIRPSEQENALRQSNSTGFPEKRDACFVSPRCFFISPQRYGSVPTLTLARCPKARSTFGLTVRFRFVSDPCIPWRVAVTKRLRSQKKIFQ